MVSDSIDLNLSLGLKHSYVPKSLTDLLKNLSKIEIFADRLIALNDYLLNHAQELSTLDAFKHQVPQCMLLLLDAIEALKAEVMKPKKLESNEAFLMKFLTLKRRFYEAMARDQSLQNHEKQTFHQALNFGTGLVVGSSSAPPEEVVAVSRRSGKEVAEGSGYRWASFRMNAQPATWQPMACKPVNISNLEPNKGCRRIWNRELHAKFLRATQYLGGPDAATPRTIQEIMQVEGLTTEQVKSHLQKHRNQCKKALEAQQMEVALAEESAGENEIPPDIYYYAYERLTRRPRNKDSPTSSCCSTNGK